MSLYIHFGVQFPLHWLLTCIPLYSFHCNLILVFRSTVSIAIWYLYFRSSLCCKICTLIFLHSFHCSHQILVFLLLQLSSLTTIFYSRKKKMIFNIIKQENYKFLVLTEYAIREKLLLLSSMPSIPLFFSCPLISSFSIPSILSSLCFPFSFFSCTSVFSFSDFG